jgi:hypothetical protein
MIAGIQILIFIISLRSPFDSQHPIRDYSTTLIDVNGDVTQNLQVVKMVLIDQKVDHLPDRAILRLCRGDKIRKIDHLLLQVHGEPQLILIEPSGENPFYHVAACVRRPHPASLGVRNRSAKRVMRSELSPGAESTVALFV